MPRADASRAQAQMVDRFSASPKGMARVGTVDGFSASPEGMVQTGSGG
jgi:hypothetical protein